jgi:uncharacterized protein
MPVAEEIELRRLLAASGDVAIAVSGGVDSVTLAAVAASEPECRPTLFHAVSPAVPAAATSRLTDLAASRGWILRLIDAGELTDADYARNPVNRCFYCKSRLYSKIRAASAVPILSGTNLDDLGDYRPGLEAAHDLGVRHPFVEAGIGKALVRRLAATMGLPEMAALPASPCLASRIETGTPVTIARLATVEAAEAAAAAALAAKVVRCRIRPAVIEIQLDAAALARAAGPAGDDLAIELRAIAEQHSLGVERVTYGPYRRGSAFIDPVSS